MTATFCHVHDGGREKRQAQHHTGLYRTAEPETNCKETQHHIADLEAQETRQKVQQYCNAKVYMSVYMSDTKKTQAHLHMKQVT